MDVTVKKNFILDQEEIFVWLWIVKERKKHRLLQYKN